MATTHQASPKVVHVVQEATTNPTVSQVKTTVRDKSTSQTANDTALVVAERPGLGVTNVPAAVELLEKILIELQVMNLYIKEGMNIRDEGLYLNSSLT